MSTFTREQLSRAMPQLHSANDDAVAAYWTTCTGSNIYAEMHFDYLEKHLRTAAAHLGFDLVPHVASPESEPVAITSAYGFDGRSRGKPDATPAGAVVARTASGATAGETAPQCEHPMRVFNPCMDAVEAGEL